ncbi:hypothetical protein EV421DRAFT_1743215 [Armillaria borealis]|uniref:Uncharacterized protein n=1 Tax=Armillaria borealis TaxID=47425 RepID=A0AA39MEH8_9AGAR|nr:hypothetical protein EV421DRAFT_1743215 [Armillaria borealis]
MSIDLCVTMKQWEFLKLYLNLYCKVKAKSCIWELWQARWRPEMKPLADSEEKDVQAWNRCHQKFAEVSFKDLLLIVHAYVMWDCFYSRPKGVRVKKKKTVVYSRSKHTDESIGAWRSSRVPKPTKRTDASSE